jgi:HSP20 family protein
VRNGAAAPASIRIDVTENDSTYVVQAEIPGAKKEDVDVTIEGNQVTINAELKRDAERKDGKGVLRSERYFGSAFRSFTLPVELDEAESTAKFENGVLELTLAKKAAHVGKKLTIQ